MSQNILKHNYDIDEYVFYYNFDISGFGRGKIVQIDIDQFLENLAPKTVVNYHTLTTNGNSYRSVESNTFLGADGSGPTHPPYELTVKYAPGDLVWMINTVTNGAFQVLVVSVDVKILQTFTRIGYLVNYDIDSECCVCENSQFVNEVDLYESSSEAFAALGIFRPSPTPTPTPSITPSVTLSSSLTPTPTPTVTVSASFTPTPTPTPTPSSSFAPSTTPASGASSLVVSKLNATGFVLNKGTPVSLDINGNIVKTSCDDSTALSYLGFVFDDNIDDMTYGRILLEGSINNTITNWNDILIEGSGLQAGKKYYLSTTPGKISLTPPTVGYIKNIGFAVDNMTLDMRDGLMIKL